MLQYSYAGVAQLAEQLFCKQQVVGSIPTTGSSIRKGKIALPVFFCVGILCAV
jgi:hypothetical protein